MSCRFWMSSVQVDSEDVDDGVALARIRGLDCREVAAQVVSHTLSRLSVKRLIVFFRTHHEYETSPCE